MIRLLKLRLGEKGFGKCGSVRGGKSRREKKVAGLAGGSATTIVQSVPKTGSERNVVIGSPVGDRVRPPATAVAGGPIILTVRLTVRIV
jgi:hypothetical protein